LTSFSVSFPWRERPSKMLCNLSVRFSNTAIYLYQKNRPKSAINAISARCPRPQGDAPTGVKIALLLYCVFHLRSNLSGGSGQLVLLGVASKA
jgi:hypothetical protein